jgi:uncharacterized protein (TIGR03437 family)
VLLNGVVNAADYTRGGVSPGDIIVIFGAAMGPDALAGLELDSNGEVSRILGETRVLFDDVAAPMVYTSSRQISAIVPYRVASAATTTLVVEYQGRRSNPVVLPVQRTKLALFTANGSGEGPAAALNADFSVNTRENRLERGSVIQLFGTGMGILDPVPADGALASAPFAQPPVEIRGRVGGKTARVLYAGAAPGLVAGVFQVNLEIPVDAPLITLGTEVVLEYVRPQSDPYPSQPGVTIFLR